MKKKKKPKNTPPVVHPIAALSVIVHNAGITHSELGRMLGLTKQCIDNRLNARKNTSTGVVCEVAEALDYELALVPKGSDYPEGSIRLHSELLEQHAIGGRR